MHWVGTKHSENQDFLKRNRCKGISHEGRTIWRWKKKKEKKKKKKTKTKKNP